MIKINKIMIIRHTANTKNTKGGTFLIGAKESLDELKHNCFLGTCPKPVFRFF